MRIIIISSGVFNRPCDTKDGQAGWVCSIIFRKTSRGRINTKTYIITKTYVTELSAKMFLEEQLDFITTHYHLEEPPSTPFPFQHRKITPIPHPPFHP